MLFDYLEEKKWSDISREERFFVSELYHDFKRDKEQCLSFIKENIIGDNKTDVINIISDVENVEVAFEVCLYRDLYKYLGKSIQKSIFPQKRTFDLCIFTEKGILIIEAKANQGYDGEQLLDIQEDRDIFLKEIFKDKDIKIAIISIHSGKYNPHRPTLEYFDGYLTWEQISNRYIDNKAIYQRANNIYRD
ncbi:hypothetical protein BX659_11123 [Orenia metallireducens]|uniref:Uncharacterized protein n=1 Tax=Orenia metallireducens TaxID=1413210 RepID=A0A285H9Y9_9FIRM|nr:hypothetical protein [Orenia metallireducens]PRX28910.1 hypothetical protein BX659_11123 [Orenia metallireducens]SNY32477.1 hypothetical protein SAMN06265827_11623 [Orenia metallireducens]